MTVPNRVEIVWALLTPKQITSTSIVKKIAVAAIYSKPRSRRKSKLLDHINQTYHQLCSIYFSSLHFILAGDTNCLKLDNILNLSPTLKQVVKDYTRLNPPRILDPIITSLSKYYQNPECLPPLDPDPEKNGKPSDHKIVVMKPINSINNNPARSLHSVTFIPLPKSGISRMGDWITKFNFEEIYKAENAYDKAELLQKNLLTQLNKFFPEKTSTFSSDDQPWIDIELKSLDRRKKREYSKNGKT